MANETKIFLGMIRKSSGSFEIMEERSHGNCIWLNTRSDDLIKICSACIMNGAVFDSAFISNSNENKPENKPANLFTVYYLFRIPHIGKILVIQAQAKEFSAISGKVNPALWDERKMQDLTGLKLKDIPDSRPLIFHAESGMPIKHPLSGRQLAKPKNTIYPIQGTGKDGESEIAVGPVHAGIIEPGHFRFHVFGEQINKLEVRMFYLHRGIEKAAEGKNLQEAIPLIESISGDESVANSVAYCNAIERALDIKVPERAEYIRAILLELERIYSHLSDLGGMPQDVGFSAAASRFAVLREDIMRLNFQVTGSRFLRNMCIIGGVSSDFDKNKLSLIIAALDKFITQLDRVEHMSLSSSTYLDRVFSTGTVPVNAAKDLALVGPVARACGISCDLRKTLPYSIYNSVPFNESVEKTGDVLARFLVKLAEVRESEKLIKWLIQHIPSGELCSVKDTGSNPDCVGIGWAEAPRGGCMFLVDFSKEGKIKRLACRTASFRNWRGIEKAIDGNIVPDFPLINKSFNMSYAGTDL